MKVNKDMFGVFGMIACILLVGAFGVGNGIYGMYRTRWPDLKAVVPDGRSGTVTSNFPYDIRVTVNVPSNTELNYEGFPKREWITDWYWNCKFYDERKLKSEKE